MSILPRILLLLAIFGVTPPGLSAGAASALVECAVTEDHAPGPACTDSHSVLTGPTSEARFTNPIEPHDPPKQPSSIGPATTRGISLLADPAARRSTPGRIVRGTATYLLTQRLRI